ncbi:DUF4382 domain-containing protein [Vibrio comitans]|uniref:DUF4382 domain-containing protein n=1 Tax=Vibrio comitans NBRC 102076 TaxID=1219078 RepID=A0A4Y3IJV3_9VIBR|nr:DUF4382 domain-containing protein [Vibrio comitans]GEA59292.1 hypothetical protein VCO01S_04850 [Vibrio comitans NBRC 102076]
MKILKYTAVATALSIGLYGCGGDSGGGSSTTGQFSLGVSDAPIDDVASVKVFYNRVVLLPVGSGEPIEFELSQDGEESIGVDLPNYQGSNVAPLVTDQEVPAGDYKLCLFALDGAEMRDDLSHVIVGSDIDSGTHAPLQVQGDGTCPQGVGDEPDAGVLYFNKTFSINAGNNDFVAEFDLRRGLKEPVGQNTHYTIQRTSVQLINNLETGHIKGTVNLNVVDACDEAIPDNAITAVNAVYVYPTEPEEVLDRANMVGFSATPTETEVAPITSANVNLAEDGVTYEYEVGFLGEGTYSLGYTCTAGEDTEEAIENFSIYQISDDPNPVKVIPNETITINFSEQV